MKKYRVNCFLDGFEMRQCEIFVNDGQITFKSKGEEITVSEDILKSIVARCVQPGVTYSETDKSNHTFVRYTKGGLSGKAGRKATTITLSRLNDKGHEVFGITSDATELDEDLRRKWRKEK